MEYEPYWHIKIFTEWCRVVVLKLNRASELSVRLIKIQNAEPYPQVYLIPTVFIRNCHKFSGLQQQKCMILFLWRWEDQNGLAGL